MRSLIEDNAEAIDIGPDGNSLDLLQAVYRSNGLPLTTRMRAAMAALKHEVPALAVQALITEQDIATVLDRRIANYERLERERKLIEHKTIEQSTINTSTNSPPVEAPPIDLPRPAPLTRIYNNRRWPRRF
jgi:hypothetical protein